MKGLLKLNTKKVRQRSENTEESTRIYSRKYSHKEDGMENDLNIEMNNNDKKRKYNRQFSTIQDQQTFLENLFIKLQLKNLNEWINTTKQVLIENGGSSLVLHHYKNDYQTLLRKIYPNYPWEFEQQKVNLKINKIEIQKDFMENLFYKLKLKTIGEWKEISKNIISSNGGRSIVNYYSNDIKQLLSTLYPNYPWDFSGLKIPNYYFYKLENQKEFMDNLFIQFKYSSMDDWLQTPISRIIQNGGRSLANLYSNDIKKLLQSIYPNQNWQFDKIISLKSLEDQRKFMNNLFIKLKLNNLDDWLSISKSTIKKQGGKVLLSYYYSNDMKKLLSTIYPSHSWHFGKILPLNTIENQRSFMDYLFSKLKLKSIDDWIFVSKNMFKKIGGKKLFKYYNNMKDLLTCIFPNHIWVFNLIKNFNTIENQRIFMEYLYYKFKLQSFDDWIFIKRKTIINNGGKKLIKQYYPFGIKKILSKIYPNYPWKFLKVNVNTIEDQKKFLKYLAQKLKFSSLDDWMNVKKSQFLNTNGGRELLEIYHYNIKELLNRIYPHYQWEFAKFKFRPDNKYSSSYSFHLEKVKFLLFNYQIREKKDFYRINTMSNDTVVYRSLKYIYPNEKWEKRKFQSKSKKSIQRLLFIYLESIFKSSKVFENYHHPHLYRDNDSSLEYDLFLPSLNLALEYQGEHHYDEIPAFGKIETYQTRDKAKELLSIRNRIKLIYIPYWWDQTASSLLSSLRTLFFKF